MADFALIAARGTNNVIGNGLEIPWRVRGEQLIFKALTFNQWVLLGRRTWETVSHLSDRKFAVLSRSPRPAGAPANAYFFPAVEDAVTFLNRETKLVLVGGGGQIFDTFIGRARYLHLSTLQTAPEGNVFFPEIPSGFVEVYSQNFQSNIPWRYSIFSRDITFREG